MGHKHHRRKKYYSATDRPIFKIVGSVLTAALFTVLYYVVVILMERPGPALIFALPCMILLIWVAMKQRHFWWIWLILAVPCIAMSARFVQPNMLFWLHSYYWAISYGMCQWLILSDSMLKNKIKRKQSPNGNRRTFGSSTPRPKDELLEKLFADKQ